MSFADDLNKEARKQGQKQAKAPTVNDFINDKVNHYTNDIKKLCTDGAKRGEYSIKGFFVPERYNGGADYYNDAYIRDEPKNMINKKPSLNPLRGGLDPDYRKVIDANITLRDGLRYESAYNFRCIAVDNSMIEKVRLGMERSLSSAGFKKFKIEHLTGPKYEAVKFLLGETVQNRGTCHYFYVDIAW